MIADRQVGRPQARIARFAASLAALAFLWLCTTALAIAQVSFTKAGGWRVADGRSQFETCTTTCQPSLSGSGAGQLYWPEGVAVDGSGDVFETDTKNLRADKFRATSNTGSNSAVPRCSTAQLRLKFVDMQAAAGRQYIDYAFKNAGARKCSLRGYPTVVLLDKQGHVIHFAHAKVGHFPASPIRTVVIGSGKRAFFSFVRADGAFCPGSAFTFYGLRVSPPNNAIGFRPHLGRTLACDASAKVSAVRPKRFPF